MLKETYRPLPTSVTVNKSSIDGLGLFATEDLEPSTKLGRTHVEWEGHVIRTPLGGFINHSDNPNCKNVAGFWHQLPVKYLMTTRKITAGEELTAKYTLYNDFDDKWQ